MKISIKTLVMFALMLVAAALAVLLRPTISLADARAAVDLKTLVPTAFGDWRELPNMSAQIVNPEQQAIIEKIYSETLSRTYVNNLGYRIMLSIAYGRNQRGALQMHKPDICYPAQGFRVSDKQDATLDLLGKPSPATRLMTNLGQRHEPITYWTVVGDHITQNTIDKRLVEIRYAIQGKIPDGMLVRVSSIDSGKENAYAIQDQFATQMVNALAPENRNRVAGDAARK